MRAALSLASRVPSASTQMLCRRSMRASLSPLPRVSRFEVFTTAIATLSVARSLVVDSLRSRCIPYCASHRSEEADRRRTAGLGVAVRSVKELEGCRRGWAITEERFGGVERLRLARVSGVAGPLQYLETGGCGDMGSESASSPETPRAQHCIS